MGRGDREALRTYCITVEDDPIPIMYEERGTEAGEQVNRDDSDARIGQTTKATSKQLRGREAD